MAQGRAAPGRARGGEDIQAPRPVHARVATAAAALVVAAALASSPLLRDSSHEAVLLVLGVGGMLALAVGLAWPWSAAVATGVGLLGAEQAVRLATGPDALDPWTPLYAGGFLLVAELAWWSLEPRVPAWAERGMAVRRLVAILLACAGGSVFAALVVLAAGSPLHGGFALELAGVLAATAALAVVAAVARTRAGAAVR